MKDFAEYVSEYEPKWAVRCVRLPGHGTSVQDLARIGEEDWLNSLRDANQELQGRSRRVVVVGLSMGAALSCRLAAETSDDKIACMILLSPVFDLRWPSNWLLGCYGLFKTYIGKPASRAAYCERHDLCSYMAYPVSGLKSLRRTGRAAWQALPRIKAPVLIVAGEHDTLVRRSVLRSMEHRLGAALAVRPVVETWWAPGSIHILTVEPDAESVFDACLSFMRRWTSSSDDG